MYKFNLPKKVYVSFTDKKGKENKGKLLTNDGKTCLLLLKNGEKITVSRKQIKFL